MHAHILHANRLAQASEPVAQGFGIGPSPLLEEACVLTKAHREDLAGLFTDLQGLLTGIQLSEIHCRYLIRVYAIRSHSNSSWHGRPTAIVRAVGAGNQAIPHHRREATPHIRDRRGSSSHGPWCELC